MVIKHSAEKAPGDKLFAAEWNADHTGTAAPEPHGSEAHTESYANKPHGLASDSHEGRLAAEQLPDGGSWFTANQIWFWGHPIIMGMSGIEDTIATFYDEGPHILHVSNVTLLLVHRDGGGEVKIGGLVRGIPENQLVILAADTDTSLTLINNYNATETHNRLYLPGGNDVELGMGGTAVLAYNKDLKIPGMSNWGAWCLIGMAAEEKSPARALFFSNAIYDETAHWLPAGMCANYAGGSATINWTEWFVSPNTGEDVDSWARLARFRGGVDPSLFNLSWDKKRAVMFTVQPAKAGTTLSDRLVRMVMGGAYISGSNTLRHIGFEMDNDELLASVGDGTNQRTESIMQITDPYTSMKLMAVYTPGEKAEFYVNDELKATITDTLPSGIVDAAHIMNVTITNRTAENKSLELFTHRFWQKE